MSKCWDISPLKLVRTLGAIGCFVALTSGCTTIGHSSNNGLVSRQALPAPVLVRRLQDRSGNKQNPALDREITALLIEALANEPALIVSTPPDDASLTERLRRTKSAFWPPSKVLNRATAPEPYIIEGSITAFSPKTSRREASVALRLTVRDPNSGRTLSTIPVNHAVRNRRRSDGTAPHFGSDAYFQTPLGQAMLGAIDTARGEITKAIPTEYWEPLIAAATGKRIILNGGRDRGFRENQIYTIFTVGEKVTDPITGKVLTTLTGRELGRLRVTLVEAHVAYAEALTGGPFKRMQRLGSPNRK
jgi:hypothetical protein